MKSDVASWEENRMVTVSRLSVESPISINENSDELANCTIVDALLDDNRNKNNWIESAMESVHMN
jgi:hypothetical protein